MPPEGRGYRQRLTLDSAQPSAASSSREFLAGVHRDGGLAAGDVTRAAAADVKDNAWPSKSPCMIGAAPAQTMAVAGPRLYAATDTF